MLVRQHRQAGFSNQQALLVLLICFPIGLIFLGLVVLVLLAPTTYPSRTAAKAIVAGPESGLTR